MMQTRTLVEAYGLAKENQAGFRAQADAAKKSEQGAQKDLLVARKKLAATRRAPEAHRGQPGGQNAGERIAGIHHENRKHWCPQNILIYVPPAGEKEQLSRVVFRLRRYKFIKIPELDVAGQSLWCRATRWRHCQGIADARRSASPTNPTSFCRRHLGGFWILPRTTRRFPAWCKASRFFRLQQAASIIRQWPAMTLLAKDWQGRGPIDLCCRAQGGKAFAQQAYVC